MFELQISGRTLSVYYLELHSVDTGRKLNVHKTFRRGPGRHLNVLCTFNLRPVSTVFFEQLNFFLVNQVI